MQGRIPSGATPDELSNTWRALTYHKRMLIVLDNAKDAAQVQPLLVTGPRCAVLITSRSTFGDATFEYESHRLGELSPREGLELLDRIAPPDYRGTPAERERVRRDRAEIVRRCQGLPLAIRLCGGRLSEHSGPAPRRVLAELDDMARSPLLRGPNGFAASFAFSLRLCAPQERLLLKRIADSDLHKFSYWSAAVLLGVSRDTARALVDELVRRFLVLTTERSETGEHTFRIHDLVRGTLRLIDPQEFGLTQWERDQWNGADDREVARRLVSAYTWLVEQAAAEVTRTHDPTVLTERTDLTPDPELRLVPTGHPRQWLTQERESLLMCLRLAEDHDFAEPGWRLAHAFAALCQVWRVFWADWEQATLAELRMAYVLGDRLAVGLARLDRAEIAGKMGDYAAGVEDANTAQRVFEQVGGRDGDSSGSTARHWKARALRSLGVNLQRRGHLDGGATALTRAERLFAEEGDNWWRARVLCDLAEVHAQRGRRRSAEHRPGRSGEGDQHRRAQALLRTACIIFRYEGDWAEYSNARIALAEVLAARGRELNAWFMLNQVRDYYERAEERWYTARCQRAMAELDTVRLDRQYDAVDLALNPARAEQRRDYIEGHVAREGRRLKPESELEHQRIGAWFAHRLREPAQRYLGEYFAAQQRWFADLPRSGRDGLRAVAEQRRRWSVPRRLEMLEEAAETLSGMGDAWGTHRTRLALGRVRLRAGGDVDESARIMREAAEGFLDLGDQLWHARAHRAAAEALAAGGHPRHALVDAERSYEAFQRLGDSVGRIGAQELFGRLLDETGRTDEAVRHLTAAREAAREEGLEWRDREANRRLDVIGRGLRPQASSAPGAAFGRTAEPGGPGAALPGPREPAGQGEPAEVGEGAGDECGRPVPAADAPGETAAEGTGTAETAGDGTRQVPGLLHGTRAPDPRRGEDAAGASRASGPAEADDTGRPPGAAADAARGREAAPDDPPLPP
nr:NB-ARC domain-containing protein [Streptomonospora sp. PA3]